MQHDDIFNFDMQSLSRLPFAEQTQEMNGRMEGVNGIADSMAGKLPAQYPHSPVPHPPPPPCSLSLPTTLINFSGCTFEIYQKDAIGNAIKFEIPPQPAAGPVTQICTTVCMYIYLCI